MKQYYELMLNIIKNGVEKGDRTGTGTVSLFGESMVFDLREGFPLLAMKKTNIKPIAEELFWFLRGSTNIHDLDAKIWDEWADEKGELGPIYGAQWRSWMTQDGTIIDQIQTLVENLRTKPDSRRHIVSAWNVAELPDESVSPQENVKLGNMALAPCHMMFQCYSVEIDGVRYLDMKMYQRSADMFLGVPFNIASYSLLLEMIASVTGHVARRFIWDGGDCHIYQNHYAQVDELMTNPDRLAKMMQPLPKLVLKRKVNEINEFTMDDIEIVGYDPAPFIKADVAV